MVKPQVIDKDSFPSEASKLMRDIHSYIFHYKQMNYGQTKMSDSFYSFHSV